MLTDFLEVSAQRFPEKIALVSGEQRFTYRQIDVFSNQQANTLVAAGVERGDRVGVYLDNSVEAVTAIFGILKANAVFVVINPATKPEKLAYILQNCAAKAVITNPRKVLPDLNVPQLQIDAASSTSRPLQRCIDIDLAALIYTSGSTGKPKGVMLTHRNMLTAAASVTEYLQNTAEDIVLNVLPLSFDYGLYQLLMMFKVSGTLVLERSFAYPAAMLETMLRERVTGLPLVPTISAILLQLDLAKWKCPALRYISNTAAAWPVSHIVKLRQLFPGVRIFSMYGLTECKRVAYLPPEQIDNRPTSVGRAIPNTEVYLVDGAGKRLPDGAAGELVVRGAHVMKGYWGLSAETAEVLKQGALPDERVLYTGDLFRTDKEGFLYFVGRKDDIIKSRGEKVSPREIEDVLCSMPQVAEAAVIGVPDAILGEAIYAFVVPREDAVLTPREVLRYCSERLEEFLLPKKVEIRAALPKSMNGKIDKLALEAA